MVFIVYFQIYHGALGLVLTNSPPHQIMNLELKKKEKYQIDIESLALKIEI